MLTLLYFVTSGQPKKYEVPAKCVEISDNTLGTHLSMCTYNTNPYFAKPGVKNQFRPSPLGVLSTPENITRFSDV